MPTGVYPHRPLAPETRAKIGDANRGRRHSPESRAAFSDAHQLPVGTCTETANGYLKAKVAEPNVWEYVHRLVYEAVYGHIPYRYVVHHIDGDQLNNVIENLEIMHRTVHARIHRRPRPEGEPWWEGAEVL
jgi:hypothetical protein